MPLLASPGPVGGGGGGGQTARGGSHVKLTVPLVELANQTMSSTLAILEKLRTETSDEVKDHRRQWLYYIGVREKVNCVSLRCPNEVLMLVREGELEQEMGRV